MRYIFLPPFTAEIRGDTLHRIASLPGRDPYLASIPAGAGEVIYIGTQIAWEKQEGDDAPIGTILDMAIEHARVSRDCPPWTQIPIGVRIDRLTTNDGDAFAVTNKTPAAIELNVTMHKPMRAVFTDQGMDSNTDCTLHLDSGCAELVIPSRWLD